ncbi:helix-turn-helix transcriptional regulator [Listeria monocytogenes]|nr:helix-turn-helix transcriptional regulator [Listeria monocytogenes]
MDSNMKLLRKQLGWSQNRLADESGVSRRTINYIENGKIKNPKKETMRSISNALRTDVEILFFDKSYTIKNLESRSL